MTNAKPEFKTAREEIVYCAQNKIPFFDDGEWITVDVPYNRNTNSVMVLDGPFATANAQGNLGWITNVEPVQFLSDMYRVNENKELASIDCSLPEQWFEGSSSIVKYTVEAEAYPR